MADSRPKPTALHQRHLRNYLLDRRFQLKYSAYLVLMIVVTSLGLGFSLWRTNQAVLEQSREGVGQGQKIVTLGRDVLVESKKVSDVVKMNIVQDPVYSDNPELLQAFKADQSRQDERLLAQQAALEGQAAALERQASELARQQRAVLGALVFGVSLFIVLVALFGIVLTHRVAGPIFKIQRLLHEVADGKLIKPGRLRKGDELVEFFETFNDMIDRLRARQEQSIQTIEAVLRSAEKSGVTDDLAELQRLRDEMRQGLERSKG